jgi:hypothetical protein
VASGKNAYDAFTTAEKTTTLEPEDLDHLARAAYLIGDDVCSAHSLTRAHAAYLSRGDARSAARSALWLAFVIMDQPSQRAQAGGWLARAQRLLDGVKDPCVEQGWLLCATARQRASAGEFATVGATFAEAAAIGERFGDSRPAHACAPRAGTRADDDEGQGRRPRAARRSDGRRDERRDRTDCRRRRVLQRHHRLP